MPDTQIITPNFKYRAINSLMESFKAETNNLYFFYARPFEIDDDAEIDRPLSSTSYQVGIKSNILSLKRVNIVDLSLGAKKYEWVSGTVYTPYNDEIDLSQEQYYVITENENVYLCLDNSNNSPSVDMPTSTATDGFFKTTDDYTWKFLGNVPESQLRKFDLETHFPLLQNETIKDNAIPGTVNRIEINIAHHTHDDDVHLIPVISGEVIDEIPLYVHGTGDTIEGSQIDVGVDANGTINSLRRDSFLTNSVKYIESDDKWIPLHFLPNSPNVTGLAYGIAKLDVDNHIDRDTLYIINGGQGYNAQTCILAQSTCIAHAVFDDNNRLSRVDVKTYGRNFTTADVIPIVNPEKLNMFSFHPIISPAKGYGYNVFLDLQVSTLLTNVRIAYEESGGNFSTQNDFRTIGLLDDVEERSGEDIVPATSLTLSGMTTLEFEFQNDVIGFELNSIVQASNGAIGRIIDIDNNSKSIRIIQNVEDCNSIEFKSGYHIDNKNIINVTKSSYVEQSGSILYIDNRMPIERHPDQIETINFILTI